MEAEYNKEDILAIKGPGMVQSMLDIKGSDDSESDSDADQVD